MKVSDTAETSGVSRIFVGIFRYTFQKLDDDNKAESLQSFVCIVCFCRWVRIWRKRELFSHLRRRLRFCPSVYLPLR